MLHVNYGVTPTANKLYSLVRKGSMGTPAEVPQGFWQELGGRTRVAIDHPDFSGRVETGGRRSGQDDLAGGQRSGHGRAGDATQADTGARARRGWRSRPRSPPSGNLTP